nr:MAG TPA: Gamma interferon inducible lysosomal thiol reductase (GILT) [Crassvirales sp.]
MENTNKIRVRGNLTLSFCPYCKYFTYTSKSNLFTML